DRAQGPPLRGRERSPVRVPAQLTRATSTWPAALENIPWAHMLKSETASRRGGGGGVGLNVFGRAGGGPPRPPRGPPPRGVGAGLGYYLGAGRGRQGRARARDRAVHNAPAGGRGVVAFERDCVNRGRGLLARLRSMLEPEELSDEVLHARVRAALGRACTHA